MVKNILLATIKAYIVSFILLLICAMVLYLGDFKDNVIGVMIVIIYFVSNLIGGLDAGKKVEKNKYLWGIIQGLIYSIGIVIISVIGSETGFSMESSKWIMLFVSVIGGMIGGMIS